MATVASIITSGRYDLRDTNSFTYTDEECLDYLNRSLGVLDGILSEIHSDLVYQEDTSITLSSGNKYASRPTRCITIRDLWIGSNLLYKKDIDYIFYKRQHISGTGQPYYYAEQGTNIIFEREADTNYSLEIYFDQESSALTSGGDMPHSDIFNEALREGMVILAKRRNEYDLNIDAVLHDHFLDAALKKAFRRQLKPKYYKLGF